MVHGFCTRTLVTSLVIFLNCASVIQAQPFVPRVVSTQPLERKSYAQIWGDRVMWRDFRATGGLYEYRLSTGIEQKVYDLELGNDHRGDLLAFEENGLPKVYNIATGEKFEFDNQSAPFAYTAISEDWLAWSALVGTYDVFARRIDSDGQPIGEIVELDVRSGIQTQVDIDGDYATWTDRSTSPFEVKLMNLATGEMSTIGRGDYPTIQGDLVAWTNNAGVWTHEITAGVSRQISEISSVEDPGVWGGQIVWVQEGEMHGFNVRSGHSFTIRLPSRPRQGTPFAFSPTVYENTVAWVQRQAGLGGLLHEVYVMELGGNLVCDFDSDGVCDVSDMDSLFRQGPISDGVEVIIGVNAHFDIDADGDIDLDDRDQWLMTAAAENGLATPYRLGDSNLDGVVDVSDFNAWNENKFQVELDWSSGNFNGDAVVDVSDFNEWNENKFTSSDALAVPEPFGMEVIVALTLFGLARRQRVVSRTVRGR